MESKIVPLRPPGDPEPPGGLWKPNPATRIESQEDGEGGGDQLWNVISLLVRRWMIIAPVAALVFAASYGSAAMSPKIYQATALVLINPGREEVLPNQALVNRSNPTEVVVESEMEVMRSPDVMERVVRELRLDEDPEWNGTAPAQSWWDRLVSPVLGLAGGRNADAPTASTPIPPQDSESLRHSIARALARDVRVRRREPSYVIEVSAASPSRHGAAAIANATAQAYLEEQTESSFEATQRAQEFLRRRAGELATDVQGKERAAEAFRVENGLPSAGADQPADVQTMLAQARADLTEKQTRLQQVEALAARGGSADLIAGAANSDLLSQLRSNEVELQRRQGDLEGRYGPRHPDVLSGQADLENLRARIRDEIARIRTGLRNEVELARRRLNSLQQNFGAETLTLDAGSNEKMIQYRQMLREADAARAMHESFLQRMEEVESQTALPVANARLMTTATPPGGPSSPNMSSALRTAIMLALALGVGAAFLVEMLDRTVSSPQEAERKLGRRTVALLPKLDAWRYRTLPPLQRSPSGYVVEKPMSDFAEGFRVLRTSLVHARVDKRVRVVAVTSALAHEGKTTVSLCLARVAAMSGLRVALVDCDLRRQSVAETLGLRAGAGLVRTLTENLVWADVLQQDEETSLLILAGATASFTPLDVFSSRAMSSLMAEMREAFDFIVLDCAPVLHVADTRIAASHADVTLMVVRADKTPVAAAKSALRELESVGVDIHGIALNGASKSGTQLNYYGSLHYGRNDRYAY